MRVKKLIEKLEDLATFLTLKQNDAGKSISAAKKMGTAVGVNYHEGRKVAFGAAFDKLDGIIKEAKR